VVGTTAARALGVEAEVVSRSAVDDVDVLDAVEAIVS
jgi:hypothetical protein